MITFLYTIIMPLVLLQIVNMFFIKNILNKQKVLLDQKEEKITSLLLEIKNLNEELSEFLEDFDPDVDETNPDNDHPSDEQYASMAESLAEKREMEADRLKDEAAERHVEEDCDQCTQDGPEVCNQNLADQYDQIDTGKKY